MLLPEERIEQIKDHIKSFPPRRTQSHYSRADNPTKFYLHENLHGRRVWFLYLSKYEPQELEKKMRRREKIDPEVKLWLYINETYLELYAGDTTVHYASKNNSILRTKLQQGSNGFLCLCISNDMHVHLQKTSIMWIGTWQNLQNLDSLDICLEQVDTQKLLGIIIDKSLDWNEQISAVCLNLTRRISLLKQLSKYIHVDSLKLYYNSYILPIFDYGCIIHPGSPVTGNSEVR